MYCFLNSSMANGKHQVPSQVEDTGCQLVSGGWVSLKIARCLQGLAEELLHSPCREHYGHTQQNAAPLHSDTPKWLSTINSLQHSQLKNDFLTG